MSVSEGSRVAVPIHEATEPTRPEPDYHPLLLIAANGSASYLLLNDDVTRVAVHWHNDSNTMQWCSGPMYCELCKKGWFNRIVAYIPILTPSPRKTFLLSIPSQALHYCETLLQYKNDLRGRVMRSMRIRAGKRGPVKLIVSAEKTPAERVPRGWDVLDDLAKRWKLPPRGDANEGGLR